MLCCAQLPGQQAAVRSAVPDSQDGRKPGPGPSSLDAGWLAGPEGPEIGAGNLREGGSHRSLGSGWGALSDQAVGSLCAGVMWFMPPVFGGREGLREGQGPDSQLII